MNKLRQGALFSGSGGFELAGLLHGIEPVWASEVEPFPVRVTTKRFPNMLHFGDINKLNGAELPPVDIISGGFPCQNLSLAGKRAGLHGERSGLFFEMVRVIREMREATQGKYPRYIVVENVMGMYSSNQGRDFLEVLNELCKIKDETISIPLPEKKWLGAGEIVGDGFSLAWRSLCASFWGVPQRRRRCYLVLDFDGESAGQILFDESRLHGNFTQGGEQRQGAAANSEIGTGSASGAVAFEPGAMVRLGGHVYDEVACTLRADMGDNQLSVVYDARGNGDGKVANTITGDHENRITDYTKVAVTPRVFGMASYYSNAMKSGNPASGVYETETARTLDTSSTDPNKNAGGMMVVCMEGNSDRPSHRGKGISEDGICYTLNTVENHKIAYDETYAMTTGSYTQVCKEQSPCLQARDFKDPPNCTGCRGKLPARQLS
jgi:DNA (cytosine-5)-methyltransferase 1